MWFSVSGVERTGPPDCGPARVAHTGGRERGERGADCSGQSDETERRDPAGSAVRRGLQG